MPLWYQLGRSAVLILQAVFGVSLFAYALRKRSHLFLRLTAATALCMLAAHIVQNLFYVPGTTVSAIATQAAVSAFNYLLVLGISAFCLDESPWTAMYVTTFGMAAQGLAGCVKTIVRQIPAMDALAHNDFGILPLDLLCYGGVYLLIFRTFRSFTRERSEAAGNKTKAIFSTVVLGLYLANTWLTRDYSNGAFPLFVIIVNIYAILIQLLIFLVQFNVMERGRLAAHLETMRELMHEQRVQYENSRENVQLINEKYHDLKKLVTSIQGVVPKEELDRLRASVEHYDVQVRTGHEVLDVVLTEKMNICLQRGITMTCNLGTADFGFLEEMDLYALFGNALSNAINAVSALPEDRKRYIILSALQEGNMLSLHVENPYDGRVEFADGLPRTEGDPQVHGFGMKSMVRTAEKYGGGISVGCRDGRFQLDILLLKLN